MRLRVSMEWIASPKQGRLALAVGADDADAFAWKQGQRNTAENLVPRERQGEVAGLQGGGT